MHDGSGRREERRREGGRRKGGRREGGKERRREGGKETGLSIRAALKASRVSENLDTRTSITFCTYV